jgi:hypothetical protein
MTKIELLLQMGRGAFGHGSKMILNIFLVYFLHNLNFTFETAPDLY